MELRPIETAPETGEQIIVVHHKIGGDRPYRLAYWDDAISRWVMAYADSLSPEKMLNSELLATYQGWLPVGEERVAEHNGLRFIPPEGTKHVPEGGHIQEGDKAYVEHDGWFVLDNCYFGQEITNRLVVRPIAPPKPDREFVEGGIYRGGDSDNSGIVIQCITTPSETPRFKVMGSSDICGQSMFLVIGPRIDKPDDKKEGK